MAKNAGQHGALPRVTQPGIRTRQPLSEAAFGLPSDHGRRGCAAPCAILIAEELNVKDIRVSGSHRRHGLNTKLKPVDTLGRELRGDFPCRARGYYRWRTQGQVAEWGKQLLNGEKISVQVNGKSFELGPDQVIVQQSGAEGYAVAEQAGYLAALRTELSEELLQEGLAREVVRRIQTLRKDADLDISDHIAVNYEASERLTAAITTHQDYIAAETLADELAVAEPSARTHQASDKFDGESLSIGLDKLG